MKVCDPETNEPLANIWDVNHWIALRRQKRFAEDGFHILTYPCHHEPM